MVVVGLLITFTLTEFIRMYGRSDPSGVQYHDMHQTNINKCALRQNNNPRISSPLAWRGRNPFDGVNVDLLVIYLSSDVINYIVIDTPNVCVYPTWNIFSPLDSPIDGILPDTP